MEMNMCLFSIVALSLVNKYLREQWRFPQNGCYTLRKCDIEDDSAKRLLLSLVTNINWLNFSSLECISLIWLSSSFESGHLLLKNFIYSRPELLCKSTLVINWFPDAWKFIVCWSSLDVVSHCHYHFQILKRGCHVNDRDGLTDMTLLHYCCKAGAHGVGKWHLSWWKLEVFALTCLIIHNPNLTFLCYLDH